MEILDKGKLLDLVDGAAIFSAGGGGASELGYGIVEKLVNDAYEVRLVTTEEVPEDTFVVNFACVGATSAVGYDYEAAVKTLRALEKYVGRKFFGVVPVELGGFNTLVAVDVAARCGIPVIDADGAGRAVPEVHLKVYTIDDIPLAPMAIADLHAENIVLVEKTADFKAAERIARILSSEWSGTAYTARRIITGKQVRASPIQGTLSRSIRIGRLLRTSENPMEALLAEIGGYKLFFGRVIKVSKKTAGGFTWIDTYIKGMNEFEDSTLIVRVKNEALVAYRDKKLAAVAPDIITPVDPKTGKCVPAERLREGRELAVIGIRAPEKWRTEKGLELWREVLQRSGITEDYVPIENLMEA